MMTSAKGQLFFLLLIFFLKILKWVKCFVTLINVRLLCWLSIAFYRMTSSLETPENLGWQKFRVAILDFMIQKVKN